MTPYQTYFHSLHLPVSEDKVIDAVETPCSSTFRPSQAAGCASLCSPGCVACRGGPNAVWCPCLQYASQQCFRPPEYPPPYDPWRTCNRCNQVELIPETAFAPERAPPPHTTVHSRALTLIRPAGNGQDLALCRLIFGEDGPPFGRFGAAPSSVWPQAHG